MLSALLRSTRGTGPPGWLSVTVYVMEMRWSETCIVHRLGTETLRFNSYLLYCHCFRYLPVIRSYSCSKSRP